MPLNQRRSIAGAVGGAKKSADVVHAAHIVKQNGDRQAQSGVGGRGIGGHGRERAHILTYQRIEPGAFPQLVDARGSPRGCISMTLGQRRVNPSDGHLVVASTPIFDP